MEASLHGWISFRRESAAGAIKIREDDSTPGRIRPQK
jgi:hypothetical protein